MFILGKIKFFSWIFTKVCESSKVFHLTFSVCGLLEYIFIIPLSYIPALWLILGHFLMFKEENMKVQIFHVFIGQLV